MTRGQYQCLKEKELVEISEERDNTDRGVRRDDGYWVTK